jgi:hypothetical protein
MPAATPPNHTTRAFFGGLEEEPSDGEDSNDEQSSIDCSQLIDPSVHTQRGMALGTTTNVESVLASVLEVHSRSDVETALSNPIPDDPNTTATASPQESPPQPPSVSSRDEDNKLTIPVTPSSVMNSPTEGPPLMSTPSRTRHTSNVDAIAYQRMEEESERTAAWAIHVVLGVFCTLVIVSSVLSFVIIQNYGLVAMMGLVLVLCFTVFLAWFVDQTVLSKNTRLKPMRQKVIHVVTIAKRALVEEFQLFKRDWQEHFLLTNGGAMDDDDDSSCSTPIPDSSRAQPAKKKRSVVFRAIKSSLRIGRRVWGRKKNEPRREQEPKYHPPNAENGVIASENGVIA